MRAPNDTRPAFPEKWAWLFPLTYVAHILEEYWAGEGFYRWIARFTNWEMPPAQFLFLNALAWLLMVAGILLLRKTSSMRWLIISYAVTVLLNGSLHLAGSLYTGTYSPGLITGLLLWWPLGIMTLVRFWKITTRRAFRAGILIGFIIHVALFLLILLVRTFE